MNEILVYGVSALLICFTVLTFLLNRLPTDIFPEDYEFKLDPFWYVFAVMFLGGTAVYFLFPTVPDMVHAYKYTDILIAFGFAVLIYFTYLLDVGLITNLVTFGAALAISYMQPDDFRLFANHLTPWQEKLAIAAIIFVISRGMGLLNGLGAIASMQFCAVMVSIVILAHFGALPHLMGALALAYLGTMIAFTFFSWPPEKIVMSHGAFSSFGFIMACFMLNGAAEFSDASMLIACSYLITEIAVALYNRFLCHDVQPELFMCTSYYKTSENGKYEAGVARGVLKILVIDIVLAMVQIAASERLALPIFAFALNLWFLSILSGDTNPNEMFSLTRLGKSAIKRVISKKKSKK